MKQDNYLEDYYNTYIKAEGLPAFIDIDQNNKRIIENSMGYKKYLLNKEINKFINTIYCEIFKNMICFILFVLCWATVLVFVSEKFE